MRERKSKRKEKRRKKKSERKEKRRKKKKYKMATAIVEWGEDKKSISVGFIRGKVP